MFLFRKVTAHLSLIIPAILSIIHVQSTNSNKLQAKVLQVKVLESKYAVVFYFLHAHEFNHQKDAQSLHVVFTCA